MARRDFPFPLCKGGLRGILRLKKFGLLVDNKKQDCNELFGKEIVVLERPM
jgi:hypothetical protein